MYAAEYKNWYVYVQLLYLATHFPEVHHSMDIWHKSKKLKQALTKVNVILKNFFVHSHIQAVGISGFEKLGTWSGNIVNHFWHSCKSCDGSTTVLKVY